MLSNPLMQNFCNAMILMMIRIKEKAKDGQDITEYANHVISMIETLKEEKEED